MKIRGEGQLRHHFWGDYGATIVIVFKDEASARDVLPKLPGCKVSEKASHVLVFHGGGDAFETIKKAISDFRAPLNARDGEPVDSVARSIDLGPPFAVEIDVIPSEQISLFD